MNDDGATTDRRIVPLSPDNRRSAYRVLATAFAADPVTRWLIDDPARDARMFAYLDRATHGAPHSADLLFDGGRAAGAAFWDPPGHRPDPIRAMAALPMLIGVFRGRLGRGAALQERLAEHRPTEPHWYLSTIGATESGRGIGSALLHHRLDVLTGPAYLESSNAANIPLYERFGFEVTGEIPLPDHGPVLWGMYRAER